MGKRSFSEQFKLDIVEQVTKRNRSVAEVSDKYGVSHNTIYKWIRSDEQQAEAAQVGLMEK